MRKVYRALENSDYWNQRWSDSGVDSAKFENMDIYPIKYTQMVIGDKEHKILEAGCGAGRVFFHYKHLGYKISGLEYSPIAVENIKKQDTEADVIEGSVCNMPYKDGEFDTLLALGLYHNFEDEQMLEDSVKESARVLKTGGRILASVRADNIENRLTEYIVQKQNPNKVFDKFHKLQFSLDDIKALFGKNSLEIEDAFYARNVSFLFKFDLLRSKALKKNSFNEQQARSKGFQLNIVGKALDKFLNKFFPSQFSNIIIVIAKKVA
ncbi:MAG: class I SAM-dependent methyltransferase [Sulfuricurvum sp.]|nr:class I SAM-dependent methyltransferase [Sulfuricurvum sp.]